MSLGRGLSSLIPQKRATTDDEPAVSNARIIDEKNLILQIDTNKIQINPHQPRESFNPDELEDLINSIKEHGIIQPLLVTKNGDNYQLIAGERRLRAAKFLNLATVPAIVREAKEQEKLEIALIENIQRKNLNPIEEAKSYHRLIEEFNLNQEAVAKRLGKNRSTVANTLRLLNLPAEIQKALAEERITEGHAKAIVALEDYNQQMELFKKIVNNKMSVRDTEDQVRRVSTRKPRTEIDPINYERQDSLQAIFGNKVEIKKRGNAGEVVIHFKSEEDLVEIYKKLLSLK